MTGEARCDETLRACLLGLDGLLHREIFRLRARYQLSLDEFRGLYISDAQVETLARELGQSGLSSAEDAEAQRRSRAELLAAVAQHERMVALGSRFDLSALEMLILFIAVAPGLDPKYETLYAYLNNDVTRKLASIDLSLRLVATCTEERLAVRAALMSGARLPVSGLLRVQTSRDHAPVAAQQALLAAHPGLPDFLLGLPFRDDRVADMVQTRAPGAAHFLIAQSPSIALIAERIGRSFATDQPRVVLVQESASLSAPAFALALSSIWRRPLVSLDLRCAARDSLRDSINRVILVCQLRDAALLVEGLDCLTTEGRLMVEATALRTLLQARHTPVLIAASVKAVANLPFEPFEHMTVALQALPRETRSALWHMAFNEQGIHAAPGDLEELVRRSHLGAEFIQAAAQRLADDTRGREGSRVDRRQLFSAAHSLADNGLGAVAQRMPQRHSWEDLVLPSATRARIRSLIDALRSRERVLEEWGMARALGAVGLRTLFAGASGTGKTMTVAVVARELGVDAYRVDLSQTVSKYIGETEKNLERIFQAAERTHAILFFDEADALLGKRAEVKDAHDRYANMEVSYLLQRLEEFDGIVIVATNLSGNIDDAFARRMQFVIEFPLPGVPEREKIWRSMFPSAAPVATDLDFDFLSRRFELAGGDIRNVALDAAFLAAGHDQIIGMRHVTHALARELVKQGRSPSAIDFKEHFSLLDTAD